MKAINPKVAQQTAIFLEQFLAIDRDEIVTKISASRKMKTAERKPTDVLFLALYSYFVMVANETKTPEKETPHD